MYIGLKSVVLQHPFINGTAASKPMPIDEQGTDVIVATATVVAKISSLTNS